MRGDHDDDDHYLCDEGLFQLVLTYLAGIHRPELRASASARIESWFVGAEREAGWDNPRAALAARLAELEERIGRALKSESDPDYVAADVDMLRQMADVLRAELDA